MEIWQCCAQIGKEIAGNSNFNDMIDTMIGHSHENQSSILWPKFKFFFYRLITYLFFLLFPILTPKAVNLPLWVKSILMVCYILFMVGQWFFLGKEIDHRIEIYFKVNSIVDRILYRIYIGMFFMALYFNLLQVLSGKWIYNSFWITWATLGLFYSWPTRGRIIQESVTTHFSELKYLDISEKILLVLSLITLIVTLPKFPIFYSPITLKSYVDPTEQINFFFWNFLTVNYYPFLRFPELFNIAWGLHFYLIGVGFYLLTFYALLRMFISRKASLLGVFAIISSTSLTNILAVSPGKFLTHSFSLLWIWAILLAIKSSTYRSGLFLGFVSFWGSVISKIFILLYPIQIVIIYSFLKKKNPWFKKQFFKYTFLGLFIMIIIFIFDFSFYDKDLDLLINESKNSHLVFLDKSFFLLAPLGLFFLLAKIYLKKSSILLLLKIRKDIIKQFFFCCFAYFSFCLIFDKKMGDHTTLLWMITFLSLIPVEFILELMNRFKVRRNIVYFVYMLICLLDSHLEERIKHFIRLFS